MALMEKTRVTLVSVQTFGESLTEDVVIVDRVVQVDDLENNKIEATNGSEKVKQLWKEDVQTIQLNCEYAPDPDNVFVKAVWRGKQLLVARAAGDVWSLPEKQMFYGTGVTMKNLVSLQVLAEQNIKNSNKT